MNCEDEEELCEEYDVKVHPTVLYFPDNTALTHEVYKGEKNYQAISNFAVGRMQSFVRFVNTNNIEEYLETEPDSVKILLFTEKKSTPPLLKSLSKEFKGKVVFGEVRASEAALISEYGIKNFPSLVGISETNSFYTRDKLEKWVRDFMYSNINTKKVSVKELNRGLFQSGKCNKGDSSLCFLFFMEKDDKISIELLKTIAKTFSKDSIGFYWVDKKKYAEVTNTFHDSMVILRGKRKKYIEVNCEFDVKCISDMVSLAISGGGNYQKLDLLPEFIETRGEL